MERNALAEALRAGYEAAIEKTPIEEFISMTVTLPTGLMNNQREAAGIAFALANKRIELDAAELHLKAMLRQATIDAWALHGDAKPAPYRDALIEKEVESSFAVVDARKKVEALRLQMADMESSAAMLQAMRSKLRGDLYAANRLLDTLRALATPEFSSEVTLFSEGDDDE